MTDRLFIRDLLVRGILGINPDERTSRQDILINLELETDTRAAAASDEIADAVNYRSVCKLVIEHVERGSDHLVERLAADLARRILETQPAVSAVRLRLEKPGALRFAASVGIEIVRRRGEPV